MDLSARESGWVVVNLEEPLVLCCLGMWLEVALHQGVVQVGLVWVAFLHWLSQESSLA